MLRSELQSLGWIPPGRRLRDTLQRADDLAREQRHHELMLEHLVIGLTEDTDAARVLEANGVDVRRFRDYVSRYIAAVDYRWPVDAPGLPVPDEALTRIFDVASAAAESSGRSEMDGALIVAAIIGEGTSNAAAMLNQHGLNIDDDEPGTTQPAMSAPDSRPVAPASTAPAAEPKRTGAADLSDIHRLLATPDEPQPAQEPTPASNGTAKSAAGNGAPGHQVEGARVEQALQNPPQAMVGAMPAERLPELQRTRPKARAPRVASQSRGAVATGNGAPPTQSHPDAVSAQQVAPGVAPSQSQPVPAPGNGASVGQVAPSPRTQIPQNGTNELPQHQVPAVPDDTEQQTEHTPPPPVEGFAQVDVNILKDILPAKMLLGESEMVEIRVLNSDIDLLTGQFEGRDVAHAGAKLVSRSLSLRLRSPSGSFSIEPRSPEVQWIDVDATILGDEATSWRWQVTGNRLGTGRLQLLASARTVSSDGTVLETGMPDQSAELQIRRSFVVLLKRLALYSGLVFSGVLLGVVAHPFLRGIAYAVFG